MGPKLLAAFGAGALVTAVVLLLTRQPAPTKAPAQPQPVAVVSAPQPEPPPPVVPPSPKPPSKRKSAKVFRAVIANPQPPVPSALALPDAEIAAEPTPVESPIEVADVALPPRQQQTVTLPAGTLLQVRLNERLASDRNVIGDAFAATLDQPLVVDGYVIAEKGARVLGRIADVIPAGRVEGVAQMALELSSITTSDGQKVNLRTARFLRKGDTSHRDDAVKVGAGAAIGAMIGAIAGGGKGAAIGAAAGGGAGTAAVLATRGKAAVLEAETRLSFRLDAPVSITER